MNVRSGSEKKRQRTSSRAERSIRYQMGLSEFGQTCNGLDYGMEAWLVYQGLVDPDPIVRRIHKKEWVKAQ